MGRIYNYHTPTGDIHVDIDISTSEDYFLSGRVWKESQELIDFGYKIISDFKFIEPKIFPANLPPYMILAILKAAQEIFDALV